VKDLILDAAREAFRADGYDDVRTKDIADRAGVVEKVIFRHFGSKAGLFEAAVVDAFATFLRNHIAAWRGHFEQELHDSRPPIAAYIGGLYDVLVENRALLQAYLSTAGAVSDRPSGGPRDLLGQALRPLDELSARERSILGFGPIDIVVTTRATFGMLLSLAIYDEFLFPGGVRPDRDAVVRECTSIVLDGWTHRR
jgi:AcrR family transcriptional regulator